MAKNVKNDTPEIVSPVLHCARTALTSEKRVAERRAILEADMSEENDNAYNAYVALAEAIEEHAPATPLVPLDHTMSHLGKFVEAYGTHPHFADDVIGHFQRALDANDDLRVAHEESGTERKLKVWKQSVSQNTAYWTGKAGWTLRGQQAAEDLGLTEGDAIINPTLKPEAIKEQKRKAEQQAEAKKVRDAYKKMPEGRQILEDLEAVHNRLTSYYNSLLDAEGLADVDADAVLLSVEQVRESLTGISMDMINMPAFDGSIVIK
jgi:hypothetical protein